jgi:hypothetical protein
LVTVRAEAVIPPATARVEAPVLLTPVRVEGPALVATEDVPVEIK